MKTSLSTMVDLMSNTCKGYCQYHVLPEGDNQYTGLALVKETLSIAATAFTKAYNSRLGVDLLAKRFPELCESLITVAKILANDSIIKLC